MSSTLQVLVRVSLLGLLAGNAASQDILHEHAVTNSSITALTGVQVAAVGDVNGDGIADYAIGAPGDGRGKVRVFSGASHAPIFTFVSDGTLYPLGTCLANLGDVDLDGIPDLALGAYNAVRVYSLGTGQPLYTVWGSFADRFGYAVASAGDVDGDGRGDFAVGAPQVMVWGGGDVWHISIVGPGFAQVFSGKDGTLLRTYTGPANLTGFGGSIANGGDLNGDGIDDLLVAPFLEPFVPTNDLLIRCYSGASGAVLVQSPTYGGARVAPLGDVDLDGTDDFAVGEPGSNVRAVSGSTGTTLYTHMGIANTDRFGSALARIGDLDGDGFPELLVGAPQPVLYAPFGGIHQGPGYGRVLSGRTGAALETFVGNAVDQGLGNCVSALGDLDGDGKEEFLVTTLLNPNTQASARIYSGQSGFSTPTNYCVGDLNSTGTHAAIGFTGSTSVSANQVRMTLTGAVPGELGVLFCGTSASSRHFQLWGDVGYLCVGPLARRLGPAQVISSQGTLQRPLDLGPASPFTPGSTWYFQFAYYGSPANPNSSDALAVTFTP
jgi:FG-GAP repeat protein